MENKETPKPRLKTLENIDKEFAERILRGNYEPSNQNAKRKIAHKNASDIKVSENKIASKKPQNKDKRALRLVWNSLFWLAFTTILVVVLVFGVFGNGDIFGFYFFEVLTESMQSEIPQGALVIVREVDPLDIVIDDDITFFINSEETMTHRVIYIYHNYENSGLPAFRTMGIENRYPDNNLVRVDRLIGRVVGQISFYRGTLDWMRSNWWMVVIAIVVVVVAVFLLKILLKKDNGDNDDDIEIIIPDDATPIIFDEDSEPLSELDNSDIMVRTIFQHMENTTNEEKNK
jgi:signal peptidase